MKINILSLLIAGFLTFFSCQAYTEAFESDEDFFKNPNTTVTIKQIIEHDGKVKAFVGGSRSEGTDIKTKSMIVDAQATLLKYEHYDDKLFSKKVLTGNVIVGENLYPFPEPYVAQQQIPYASKGESQQEDGAPLGQWYTVYRVLHNLRPDGTVYDLKTPLYQQKKVEEARATERENEYCIREKDVVSKWKFKTRHTIHVYKLTDVYAILWQRKLNGSDEQKVSENIVRTDETLDRSYTSCSKCAPKK
ncbi:hypothetical protein IM40_01220 [Candidatus Paracaedimonas acanthamoebae]|nr:hypothetical protein IM40_01220 [Candidatus Paracaedimonas acanthamoebae]